MTSFDSSKRSHVHSRPPGNSSVAQLNLCRICSATGLSAPKTGAVYLICASVTRYPPLTRSPSEGPSVHTNVEQRLAAVYSLGSPSTTRSPSMPHPHGTFPSRLASPVVGLFGLLLPRGGGN
jgi:hypothetical protein